MRKQTFAPGFRLSVVDGIVLVAGVIAVFLLSTAVWWWGFVVGFVLGHFILFCNIVRIARPLELIWSGVFVVLAAATIALDVPGLAGDGDMCRWLLPWWSSESRCASLPITASAGNGSIRGCPPGGKRPAARADAAANVQECRHAKPLPDGRGSDIRLSYQESGAFSAAASGRRRGRGWRTRPAASRLRASAIRRRC